MNTIGIIFLVALLIIITVLALVIDYRQIKKHEKIKQDHLKSLRDEKRYKLK
jgi:hypothetical protein